MSNLQIGLAVAGGVVLAAVVAHGAWTSRKNQPRQADAAPLRLDPALELEEPISLAELKAYTHLEKRPAIDALIDAIASIELEYPVSAKTLLAHLPSTRRVGSKPFAIEACNEQSQVWEFPVADQLYTAVQAGLQLVNRSGALNEIEYSEFVVKVQSMADALDGSAEFPEMRDEINRARELDQFASAHDAQLSFTVRAVQSAWSAGYVGQTAAQLGFVNGSVPGKMVLPSNKLAMPALLSLAFDSQAAMADDPAQTAIRELTLTLDVSQVERAEQPFLRLREMGERLSQAMEGVVTDDNSQPLSAQTMDAIATELETVYDTLEMRGLAAGSSVARRLFS
jgi:hypothetical protein